jgi:4-amino-4-deoxy-L-arabinose transferase-like glycosyltransferase
VSGRLYAILIAIIVTGAFVIRYRGVWFGYPLPVHPDEGWHVEAALEMLRTGDWNPHYFNYPSLNKYLLAGIYSVLPRFEAFFFNIPADAFPHFHYYVAGRIFVVLLSTATVYVVYEIGRRLIHPIAGLAGAVFLATSYLHILNSFTVTVDSPVAFWASLAALMAVLIYTKGTDVTYYILGGIAVGCAIGSKYTALVAFAPLAIAHAARTRTDDTANRKRILYAFAATLLTFLLTTPYAILDFKAFSAALKYLSIHYSEGHAGSETQSATSYGAYASYLVRMGYGLFPLILAGIGLVYLAKRNLVKASLLLSTPILLFLLVGRYRVYFERNVVAVIPFLSLMSGAFIYMVFDWSRRFLDERKRSRWYLVGVAAVLILVINSCMRPQIVRARSYIREITLPDTRWLSMQWIEQNVPEGARIGREHYTPPVEELSDRFNVSYLGYFALVSRDVETDSLDYMILSSGDYGRFFISPERYARETAVYDSFFTSHELVKEFEPAPGSVTGPKIGIFRILHNDTIPGR